ncbi:N-acetyl sugar amidotransferase [Prochlorococcus marinus str. MU1402]|uniref:N-acetyl sugar amidotransferase n=1 Tax=Prochlorococcus marinus TaxID=1219 RepID=UPI001ADCD483|nr:N-acetyl sugar amidotransferase [Prochlorococcus marinus]MBO8232359.1 N-acetyl sugar amidotransferase [Prochlorococcus marinus XMU1402]MBW3057087.1 N-acetyl sugar amidotransferase [Prochlorococcus marinus str. MU1402]
MKKVSFKTCKRCLYDSNHPLGLIIDNEGICSGCRIHEEKDSIDWDERWNKLVELVKPYKSKDSRNYDCIVPVTGAGDSFYILHNVKNKLGLNPLLVTYNRYYNTPLGIHNLATLRRNFNCDILTMNVNPTSVKKIIKTTLRRLKSFQWPALAGQSVFPVQTAVTHKIPLIIWGAHQGLEQVGMFSHLHDVEMTRRYRKDHDLMGYEPDDLLQVYDSLNEEDIWQYRYPSEAKIESIGIRGIYLGNYIRWDPLMQHKEMIKKFDYKSSKLNRTFDTFDHVDDWFYMNMHDIIKQKKHGFSKVTDHACREIRHKRISREDARNLIKYYSQMPSLYNQLFCDWLGIENGSINFILDSLKIRNPNEKNKKSKIITIDMKKIGFKANSSIVRNIGEKLINVGKGYP